MSEPANHMQQPGQGLPTKRIIFLEWPEKTHHNWLHRPTNKLEQSLRMLGDIVELCCYLSE